MKNKIICLLSFFMYTWMKCQVGIGTTSPSNLAVLELNSNNKGLFMSKVQLINKTSPSPFTQHTEGMWIYNSSTSGIGSEQVFPGLYYNNGVSWIPISAVRSKTGVGNIKASINTTDHDGWYKLDGRNIDVLPPVASVNASYLGLTTSLPNATGRLFKGKTNTETFGTMGGSLSRSLTFANLPNFSISGTTSSDGLHSHSIRNYPNRITIRTILTNIVGTNSPTIQSTTSDGNHMHSISVQTGGYSAGISLIPSSFNIQYFIFLDK